MIDERFGAGDRAVVHAVELISLAWVIDVV